MPKQGLLSKFNWRQVLAHSIASWFFIHAFQTFSLLYDTRIVEIARMTGDQNLREAIHDSAVTSSELTNFDVLTGASGFFGLIAAFIISLLISKRRQWPQVNSFIVLLIMFILYKFIGLGWWWISQIFLSIGKMFSHITIELLVNGLLLLLIGLLIFFLKPPNRFIESGRLAMS